MKSIFFFVAVFLHLSLVSQVKKIDPPGEVKTAFVGDFPAASKINWDQEGINYEVNFLKDQKHLSAVYNKTGILMETELSIKPAELPATIRDYIDQHYNKSVITEAARINKTGGEINYEARVNNYDLIFNQQGKFIRKDKD